MEKRNNRFCVHFSRSSQPNPVGHCRLQLVISLSRYVCAPPDVSQFSLLFDMMFCKMYLLLQSLLRLAMRQFFTIALINPTFIKIMNNENQFQ